MTKRFFQQTLVTVALAGFLSVSIVAPMHAATRSWFQSSVTQKASKPAAGPYAGEPDVPQGGPLPPKDGQYPTLSGPQVPGFWGAFIRDLLLSLVGRLGPR